MLTPFEEIEQRLRERAAASIANALEWDGIPPGSPHYAFSAGNPFRVEFDEIVRSANALGIRIVVDPS